MAKRLKTIAMTLDELCDAVETLNTTLAKVEKEQEATLKELAELRAQVGNPAVPDKAAKAVAAAMETAKRMDAAVPDKR